MHRDDLQDKDHVTRAQGLLMIIEPSERNLSCICAPRAVEAIKNVRRRYPFWATAISDSDESFGGDCSDGFSYDGREKKILAC